MSVPVRDDVTVLLLVPTAINVALLVSENISDNLRLNKASNLELPSLYRRAFLIVGETDEVGILRYAKGR
jgi:hypothetical protein